MADKTIYINFERGTRINADGSQDTSQLSLYYQEVPNWTIVFLDNDNNEIDLSHITAWGSAVDDDFDHSTDVWVRVLDADIDSSNANLGAITIPVDSDTSTFETGIGTSDYKVVNFELRGLNVAGELEVYTRFEILAKNTLNGSGTTSPDPAGNYYTKTESDAKYMANVSGTEGNIITAKSGGGLQDSGIELDDLNIEVIGVALSDEDSDLTTGVKATIRVPFDMVLTGVRANVNTAPTGAEIEVDIEAGGTSILSTLITIDDGEKTSTTATTQPVISTSYLADDTEVVFILDGIGSTTTGTGLKVWLIGYKKTVTSSLSSTSSSSL